MQKKARLLLAGLLAGLAWWAALTAGCAGEEKDLEAIREVYDTYLTAWHEPNEAARQSILEAVFAEDAVYHDPIGIAHGQDQLVQYIGQLQQQFPGFRIELTSGLDPHHNIVRTAWDVLAPDGSEIFKGNMAFTEIREGRVQRDVVFLGPPPDMDVATTGEDIGSIRKVVDAYVSAWNEPDEAARKSLLETSWANDGIYLNPQSAVEGRDALLQHIAGLQREMPGVRLEVTSGIGVHHEEFRFTWKLPGQGGSPIREGVVYGSLASDGRLARIVEFLGAPPPLSGEPSAAGDAS